MPASRGGAVGALAGGLVSIVAAAIAVGALGAVTAYFVQRDEKAANGAALEAPLPSKLQELVFLVLVSPVVLAPVWAPLLVYRIGLLIVGAT